MICCVCLCQGPSLTWEPPEETATYQEAGGHVGHAYQEAEGHASWDAPCQSKKTAASAAAPCQSKNASASAVTGAAFWTEFEQQLEEKNSTSSATLDQQQQRYTADPAPAGAQPVPRTSEFTWEEVRIELNRGATSLRPDGLSLHLSFPPSITIHFISSFFCF